MKEEAELEIPKKRERIKTITELYLINRTEMLVAVDEYQYYRRLIESISIGASMVEPELRTEIENELRNPMNYPETRNMNWLDSRGIYSCSSGDGITGKVTVRPEELEVGEISLRNQQCNYIIKRLSPLDRRIFNYLIEKKIIRVHSISESIEATMVDL